MRNGLRCTTMIHAMVKLFTPMCSPRDGDTDNTSLQYALPSLSPLGIIRELYRLTLIRKEHELKQVFQEFSQVRHFYNSLSLPLASMCEFVNEHFYMNTEE